MADGRDGQSETPFPTASSGDDSGDAENQPEGGRNPETSHE